MDENENLTEQISVVHSRDGWQVVTHVYFSLAKKRPRLAPWKFSKSMRARAFPLRRYYIRLDASGKEC